MNDYSSMLESLCNNLYDVLRPLIIHVNHLETLAELCGIMKVGKTSITKCLLVSFDYIYVSDIKIFLLSFLDTIT